MDLPAYWAQVMTIVIANLGMLLWATRQSRSDYLYMDKKFEYNRRDLANILEKHTKILEKHIESNNELLKSFEEKIKKGMN